MHAQLRKLLLVLMLGVGSASLCIGQADAKPPIRMGDKLTTQGQQPPTNAYCETNLGYECLSPSDIRTAYGLDSLLDAGQLPRTHCSTARLVPRGRP